MKLTVDSLRTTSTPRLWASLRAKTAFPLARSPSKLGERTRQLQTPRGYLAMMVWIHFSEKNRTREDSPSTRPKKADKVSPATSIPQPPPATSRHALDDHSTRTGQDEVNETSLHRTAATIEAKGDTNERPAPHNKTRNVESSRVASPKSRAVDRGAGKATRRSRLDRVKGLVRAARDVEALIRQVRPGKGHRRILSSHRVAQLAIQEKMDSIQVSGLA